MALDSLRDTRGIPVGFLTEALDVASSHGYYTPALLQRFDIPAEKLTDAGNRVSLEQYYGLVDHLLERGDIPGLGLLQARAETFADHGLMGTAFQSSENLRSAAAISVRYRRLFGSAADWHLEESGGLARIVCLGQGAAERYRWSVENALAGWANMICLCLGAEARFTEVHLSYPDPGYGALYEETFNCPVHFDHSANELCLPVSVLDTPFPNANAALRQLCVTQCEKALNFLLPGRHLIDHIEGLILSSAGCVPKLEAVADSLSISTRTLHRRLKDQGSSYRGIVEALRSRLAAEYLGDTNLEPKKVAFLLGYSEPANFYHAFQRWYGCSPLTFRKKHSLRQSIAPTSPALEAFAVND